MTAAAWNPYYAAYARATGAADPSVVFERDGGNAAFMGWNTRQWAEWRRAHGIAPDASPTEADRAAYEAWLERRYPTDPARALRDEVVGTPEQLRREQINGADRGIPSSRVFSASATPHDASPPAVRAAYSEVAP